MTTFPHIWVPSPRRIILPGELPADRPPVRPLRFRPPRSRWPARRWIPTLNTSGDVALTAGGDITLTPGGAICLDTCVINCTLCEFQPATITATISGFSACGGACATRGITESVKYASGDPSGTYTLTRASDCVWQYVIDTGGPVTATYYTSATNCTGFSVSLTGIAVSVSIITSGGVSRLAAVVQVRDAARNADLFSNLETGGTTIPTYSGTCTGSTTYTDVLGCNVPAGSGKIMSGGSMTITW